MAMEKGNKKNVKISTSLGLDILSNELRPRVNEFKRSFKSLVRNPTALAGLMLVIFVVMIGALAPLLAPPSAGDPLLIPKDLLDPKPPFIKGHPLGTGTLGIDMYYGIVWGARTTLTISIFVIMTSAFIGILLGAISGYNGGKIDDFIMRISDVFLSLPGLILAMAVASVLERNIENIMLALIVVWWPSYARLVRAQVLSVRENTYVEAATAIGCKKSRILFRHIVPNSLSPIIVSITMDMGAVALVAAGLSYIGFGVQSGYAEWGRMVSDGQLWFLSIVEYPVGSGVFYNPWWVVTFPGIMILLFTMGFSLVGDALRDILDPRFRR